MNVNINDIIAENKIRLARLNSYYNPITGEGSPIPRTKLELSDADADFDVYIPASMLGEEWIQALLAAGSLKAFSASYGVEIDSIREQFLFERFKHDFEFWAFICITIQDKESLKDIPFKLRDAQRIILKELEEMRLAGLPIRIILLKARQFGGSTLIQIYMMWLQQLHRRNWHLAICAQDDGAAQNISMLYKRTAEAYPKEVGSITFSPYARSPKNSVCNERGCIIGVGSVNNPNQFRSYNYPMIHISEAGVWQDTPKRTAAALISSLRSTVPNVAYSMIVIESTAKGVGNFFHREYMAASKNESRYRAIFVPWFKIDMYQLSISDAEYPTFISTMSEHDWFAWKQGATLEGIKWYNKYQADEKYEDSQMFEEYPTSAQEAFISTGMRVFPYEYISNARKTTRDPQYVGDIYPAGLANKEALKDIRFADGKAKKGNLKIWKMPEPYVVYKGARYFVKNRYCGFGDIGGINRKADFSCLKILDRYWMLFGGVPETAALWHGHLDQDLVAWKFAQLGHWYNDMLLAIEANSLKKEKTDGDYFITVLDNIAPHYDNLFIRNNHEAINTDYIPKYGFQTGRGNKDMIITKLLGGFRGDVNGNPLLCERDSDSLDECDWYERKPDGSMGAVEGQKDDRVIITAGSYWLATSYMDPVELIPYVEPGKNITLSKTIISEASL